MPNFNTLSVTVKDEPVSFVPAQNGATSVWIKAGVNLENNSSVTYTRRPSTSKQATRKSAFGLTIPYSSVCEQTCNVTSRGVSLFKLDNTVDTRVTLAEREAAYETFVQLLLDPSIKDAIVNNGSFYS